MPFGFLVRIGVVAALLSGSPGIAQQASVEQAMRLAAAGKLADAESMLSGLARAEPETADIHYRLGLVVFKLGRAEEARKHLETAAKLNPQLPFVNAALALTHEGIAKVAVQQGDAPRAAAELQRAIQLDPTRGPYYLELAQLLLDHETPEPAEVVLNAAAQRFPKEPAVLRMLTLARFAQGKYQPAAEAILRAIDADPNSEASYAALEALIPEAGERLGAIIARLRKFTAGHLESPLGAYLLAIAGEPEREKLLRTAIRVAPDFWPAHFELHKVLVERGDREGATRELLETVRLNPDYAPAHYSLAELYNRAGDRVRAGQEREIHHKLLSAQREAAEKHRAQAPRLAFEIGPR